MVLHAKLIHLWTHFPETSKSMQMGNSASSEAARKEQMQILAQKEEGERMLPKPWRCIKASSSEMVKAIRYIQDSTFSVKHLNILLIGRNGNGKSSFLNNVDSALNGRYTFRAIAAHNMGASQTKQLKIEEIDCERQKKTHIRLFDTIGWKKGAYDISKFRDILAGKYPHDHDFKNENIPTTAVEENRIHCVVYVMDIESMDHIDSADVNQLAEFGSLARDMEINVFGILTKVDKMLTQEMKTTDNIYKKCRIKTLMEKMSNELHCPLAYIFPIMNYGDSTNLDDEKCKLALDAFTKFVNAAIDYVKRRGTSGSCNRIVKK